MAAASPVMAAEEAEKLATAAIDWSLANGLVMRALAHDPPPGAPAVSTFSVVHAPFALFPSEFPKEQYGRVMDVQPIWNKLVHAISSDGEFLDSIMESLSKHDEFTGRVYAIYKAVRKEGVLHDIHLGLHRSDYMIHAPGLTSASPEAKLYQVEINTIASSFSSLSSKVSDLHRYLVDRLLPPSPAFSRDQLPTNPSMTALPAAMAKAWELYGSKSAVLLLICQPNERNAFDQRWIEYTLFEKHGIRVLRRSLSEVLPPRATLQGPERRLYVDGEEVAVVYYRAGYTPVDYPSEKEWEARLLIERSRSVKCPSAAYHLTGTKKIQQVLALPGILEKFLSDKDEVASLRKNMTGLYPLDDSELARDAIRRCMASPEDFVLKPQREGGGNNVYGKDIPPLLKSLSLEERQAYILMDRIRPPPANSFMVRNGVVIDAPVVSELGVYGTWVSDGNTVHINQAAGHLLRTKSSSSDEGGVAAGFAVLDSPLLR
ncbi:glutathione synthase [Hyaloraphidium curvatum]|nr:glutathione synthase [Hyaloraphidium curvatum]